MKADVVVAAGGDPAFSVNALYRTGSAVGRVIAVCDFTADRDAFRTLQDRHADLVVLRTPQELGRTAGWNRGLFLRQRDVLLLGAGATLAEGALEEMLEVLHGSDRIASVVPVQGGDLRDTDLRGLPRLSDIPAAEGPCVLLRHAVLNMIGGFDPALDRADDAQSDWSMRAQRLGLRHVRANRAVAAGADTPRPEDEAPHATLLLARHPHLQEQAAAALLGGEGHLVEHLLAGRRGPLRICASLPASGEPMERFQVLYQSSPIDDMRQLLAVLETPCHLVLLASEPYRNRAMLFAAGHSAQAVVARSEQERAALIEELALEPARIVVVEPASGLAPVFRKVVEHPDAPSLRYRSLLANYLRSLPRNA